MLPVIGFQLWRLLTYRVEEINFERPGRCGMDISVETTRTIATGIMGIFFAWRIISLLMHREHVGISATETIKEFAVFAVVFAVVQLYATPAFGEVRDAISTYGRLVDEVYMRHVKYHQCVANLRLSGPFSAYASYAEAKYAVYAAVYTDAMARLSAIHGAALYILSVGPILLAVGFLLYAAWLRPLGAVLIATAVSVAVGAVVTAEYVLGKVDILQDRLRGMDFHPFVAVGCDDRLLQLYARDLQGWREVSFVAPLAMALIAIASAAAAAVLSRH